MLQSLIRSEYTIRDGWVFTEAMGVVISGKLIFVLYL